MAPPVKARWSAGMPSTVRAPAELLVGGVHGGRTDPELSRQRPHRGQRVAGPQPALAHAVLDRRLDLARRSPAEAILYWHRLHNVLVQSGEGKLMTATPASE